MPKFRGPRNRAYRSFFEDLDINVDEFTVEVSHGTASHHLKILHGQQGWNRKRKDWIDANPDASAKDVYQFAGRMMDDHGLAGIPLKPYRRR